MSDRPGFEKQQLVESLGQLCQQHLVDAFKKFHPACAKQLTDLAAEAGSNRLQTLYFDTVRLLKKQHLDIEMETLNSIARGFEMLAEPMAVAEPSASRDNKPPATSRTASRRRAGDHFKLLEHEDLEVMIALDNFSSRAREQLRGELYELEGRLKTLLGQNSLPSPLPLFPDALLEAFVGSLDGDLIAVEVQLELVRAFAQICFDKPYGQMLNLAIDQLEEAGCELLEDYLPAEPSPTTDQSPEPAPQVSNTSSDRPQALSAEPLTALQPDSKQALPQERNQNRNQDPNQEPTPQFEQPVAGHRVEEQREAYTDQPLITNTRIQTELLARINSMLENAQIDADANDGQQQSKAPGDANSQASPHSNSNLNSHSHSHSHSNSNSNPNQTRVPCMAKPQLFAEINKQVNDLIAHSTELASNGQITRDLAAAIKQLEKGKRGSRLHRNDATVFQVVENIFSSFGQSMVVAPEMQQVINRCEIPMLKMALKKPLILEQENHPIRRLFNEMAKYAIGLEQGDCEDNKIYQQMVKMSETMLDDSFDEQRLPQIFSEFMSLLDRDRRMTAMAEEKEVERVAAQEKINWARTRVEEEISKRMVGREHPQAVIDFVQRSWCVVLHMAHQRNGESGADWQVGLKLLDNLLYLANRPLSDQDLKYRHELIKHIDARLGHISTDIAQRSLQIEQLSEALGIASSPESYSSAKVTRLTPRAKHWAKKLADKGRSLTQAEDQLVGEIKRVLMSAVKTELPGKNISRAVSDSESVDSLGQRCLGALQKGCWIELGGDIKAHKRGRLAGIVGPAWKYVFVDNQGKLIAARDRARLAVDLLNGSVTVLDNSHLFDKAIKEAIMQIKELPIAS